MNIQGKVVAKFQQEGNASFARILVGRTSKTKAALMKFVDIPDQGELNLGDKLIITINRVPKEPAKVIAIDIETRTQDWSQCCICRPGGNNLDGHFCMKHAIEQGMIPALVPKVSITDRLDGPVMYPMGGCVSVPDPPSVSETLQAELEPIPVTTRASWPSTEVVPGLTHSQE